jgi:type I restriction enzyme S subunit
MNKDNEIFKLPIGWTWSLLGDITLKVTDGSHNPPKKEVIGIPMLSAKNISNGNIDFNNGVRYITEEAFYQENERTNIEAGDVLLTIVASIGRSAIVPEIIKEKFTIQRSVALIKPCIIPGKYLMYAFQAPFFQKLMEQEAKGTAQKGIYLGTLKALPIPIPPLNEQYQIVEKLEEIFSELQEANQSLEKAQKILSVYEYVVLKLAFEGTLTKEWRDENHPNSAFQFLSDLAVERKSKYDMAVSSNTKVKAKDFNYDFVFSEHKEINSWAVAKLDKLIYIAARVGWKGLKREEYTSSGPLFLSVHSLNHGKIVKFDEAFHISEDRYSESPEIMLSVNDILLCKDGAGIGKVSIVKHLPTKATINSSLLIVRGGNAFDPDFLYHLFRGPEMQRLVNDRISGSSIPHLFQKDIKEFVLNVPSIEEQKQIVQEIESRFTIIEKLQNAISESQSRSKILKHVFLNNAFSGKLTIQDHTNEIGSDLIKKIKEEKKLYLQTQKELAKSYPKTIRVMEEKKSIIQVLESSVSPLSAKEVWLQSKHKDDIESFYSELREVQDKIIEIKKDTESLLALRHEN